MARPSRARRFWESLMSSGTYAGEPGVDGGKRRIVVGYFFFGALSRLVFSAIEFGEGLPGVGIVDASAMALSIGLLFLLRREPRWFTGIAQTALFLILVEVLASTVILGGLVSSEMIILFGLLAVVGALIILSTRAALGWTAGFVVTLVLAAVLPDRIDPVHEVQGSAGGIVMTTVGVTVFVFAAMAYFVRQRDRYQRESDDLLHNVLPDEIARRLKVDDTMIADHYESASVLFADVVGFTPMSAAMSPPEVVGLLNTVFTVFDGFVSDLGLEKIKTVGDEYMVAAGVPTERPDHATAIAELALRIRDHVARHHFDGQRIVMRIGIHSGPLVAGIVGIHKFAYDLWGDTVNVASRMESGGVPGEIQVTSATYELIRGEFECRSRGVVAVKGRGDMETYFLVSRRTGAAAPL